MIAWDCLLLVLLVIVAAAEGVDCLLIEREAEYVALIERRTGARA